MMAEDKGAGSAKIAGPRAANFGRESFVRTDKNAAVPSLRPASLFLSEKFDGRKAPTTSGPTRKRPSTAEREMGGMKISNRP